MNRKIEFKKIKLTKEQQFIEKMNKELAPFFEVKRWDMHSTEYGFTIENLSPWQSDSINITDKFTDLVEKIGKEIFNADAQFNNSCAIFWFYPDEK
ncbi:unnamed protein product [marine sediment metagenome]|uniref:Uncharacterized protein n=1 Tax=marine sediment metagenome TaxID=412755 RepID=X0V5F7_9ZZZZ